MLVPGQMIRIKWNWQTREHYEQLGYSFSKYQEEFEVCAERLTDSSNYFVELICDYCHEPFEARYSSFTRGNKIIVKTCCPKTDCMKQKRRDCVKEVHGVEHIAHIEGVNQKRKNTMKEKYGVETPLENKEIYQKMLENNKKKYGVENLMYLEETKEKIKRTNLEKYGVENTTQLENVREKMKQTMVKKYGTENPNDLKKRKK